MFPLQTTAPTRSPPLVTWGLIAANCAIFLFQIGLGPDELEHFLYQFALIPARYFAPLPFKDFVGDPLDYLPFVSNMFLHGGWLHLILNMWTLWLFGPAVEDRLGSGPLPRLLRLLRRLCLATPTRPSIRCRPFRRSAPRARSPGVLAGFLLLFPFARLVILVPILFLPFFFEVPAVCLRRTLVPHRSSYRARRSCSRRRRVAASPGGPISAASSPASPSAHCCMQSRRRYRPYYADEGDPRLPTHGTTLANPVKEATCPSTDIFWIFFILSALQPVVRQQLLERDAHAQDRADLKRKRDSRVILLVHRQETMRLLGFPLVRYIDVNDSEEVLRAIQMTDEDVPLDIVLHTPGGLVLAASQIARAVREHKAKVTVFVPHYAMSGGTLISLAADEIVMSKHAVLGPVDPQLGQSPGRLADQGRRAEADRRDRRRDPGHGRRRAQGDRPGQRSRARPARSGACPPSRPRRWRRSSRPAPGPTTTRSAARGQGVRSARSAPTCPTRCWS